MEYTQPELTEEETNKYSRVAAKINNIRDVRLRLVYVAGMIYENVRLVKQVNELRARLGLEPIPVYDPEKHKNGRR